MNIKKTNLLKSTYKNYTMSKQDKKAHKVARTQRNFSRGKQWNIGM